MAKREYRELPLLSARDRERFWKKIDKRGLDECWLWKGYIDPNGYGIFTFAPNRSHQNVRAHRIAYFLEHGIDPGSLMVCHTCDVRTCVNPNHLWLGTNIDNTRDAFAKGRRGEATKPPVHRGETNRHAKLTEGDVIEIRRMYATGLYVQREIGARFGIVQSAVCSVVNRRKWSHVA